MNTDAKLEYNAMTERDASRHDASLAAVDEHRAVVAAFLRPHPRDSRPLLRSCSSHRSSICHPSGVSCMGTLPRSAAITLQRV